MRRKPSALYTVCVILLGACLLGMLWRVRGTSGWGSSWGLLNAGFVFLLFLNVAVNKQTYVGFPLIGLSALSFMLTCPAWGTYLNQITGILSVSPNEETVVQYEISPFSGILMMLLLGFGLASVYGILLGRSFGEKNWRIRDYVVLAAVFVVTDLAAKAGVSHLVLKLIEPNAVTAFADGLRSAEIQLSPYAAYMSHFSAVSWAKKLIGGRNYFSSVGTISLVFAAIACFLTTRFYIKDRYAAKTGVVVCAAFSLSITLSDLFFFFGNGGYHMSQGFSLPENCAPWSLWEYFTGFIAGGIITAWLLKTASGNRTAETAMDILPEKLRKITAFALAAIAGVGLNMVRPMLERIQNNTTALIVSVTLGILIFIVSFMIAKRNRFALTDQALRLYDPLLCLLFVLYNLIVYMFIGKPEIGSIGMLHNMLVAASAVFVSLFLVIHILKNKHHCDSADKS